MRELTEEQKHQFQFFNLVMSFGQGAMIGMGKVPNPATGKVEIDLNEAAVNIDLLAMLQAKTKGNLSREEQNILDMTLTNSRLTYVAELERQHKTQPPPAEPTPPPSPEPPHSESAEPEPPSAS